MCDKKKKTCVCSGTNLPGDTCSVPGSVCWTTSDTGCACGKAAASKPLDYTKDEFSHLVGMLMGVREFINQIGENTHKDFLAEDAEVLTLAHTIEKQLLLSIQSYVTDATAH
jgi:hypothetical protein